MSTDKEARSDVNVNIVPRAYETKGFWKKSFVIFRCTNSSLLLSNISPPKVFVSICNLLYYNSNLLDMSPTFISYNVSVLYSSLGANQTLQNI